MVDGALTTVPRPAFGRSVSAPASGGGAAPPTAAQRAEAAAWVQRGHKLVWERCLASFEALGGGSVRFDDDGEVR